MGETSKVVLTAPKGAPKVVALIAALMIIREGIALFWTLIPINTFYGIMEIILAGILIIALNIVDFGVEFHFELVQR